MAVDLNKQSWSLTDDVADDLAATLETVRTAQYVPRIWAKDGSLWRAEPEHQTDIENRLGWLTLPGKCLEQVDRLRCFADQVREEGFAHVVLLGMGGSSLATWALERMFGGTADYPSLSVLDSTVPEEVLAATKSLDPAQTLFVVSSKSGTTTEVLCFFEYFYEQVTAIKGAAAGQNFVVITDAGTPLAQTGYERGLRTVFENWADVGGRFSALSYFGVVPAALLGLPLREILAGAETMAQACGPAVSPDENPGACLGALLGCCQARGRDKVTLLTSPTLASFGDWVEQLLAESTGKDGTGLIPVVGEQPGKLSAYADDRLFVYLHMPGEDVVNSLVAALAEAGHPVVGIEVADLTSIGQEMFRWEFATTVAGALMGINPFDQPNVQESKDKTCEMLDYYCREGHLPQPAPDLIDGGLTVYGAPDCTSAGEALMRLLGQVNPGDYVGLMAYLARNASVDEALAEMRRQIGDALKTAITVGYGPRLLHSTGQLHKGGPNSGVFLQFTARDSTPLPIPGREYDFATLKNAQAYGDFAVLRARQRRVMRIDLGGDIDRGMGRVSELLRGALHELARGAG